MPTIPPNLSGLERRRADSNPPPTQLSSSPSDNTMLSSSGSNNKPRKQQRIIVIKYFEESDKYAKIIPRTATHILKRRYRMGGQEQQITYEQIKQLTHITGRDIVSLIKNDQSDWLQQYNPIQAVMLFNQGQNRFIQVTSEMQFAIPKLENVFTFHVKRKVKVERLIGQSTMTFSVITAAETWLFGAYEKMMNNQESSKTVGLTIRYYDIFHHGYTKLNKGDQIAVGRTGKTMVKLLLEKILPEAVNQQDKLFAAVTSFKEEDAEIFEDSDEDEDEFGEPEPENVEADDDDFEFIEKVQLDDEFYLVGNDDVKDYDEDNFEMVSHDGLSKYREYSRFVDLSKVPRVGTMVFLQKDQGEEYNAAEKERRVAWKKIKEVPQSHKDTNPIVKKLIRRGIPELRRKVFWMGITGATTLLKQQPSFYEKDFEKLYGTYKQSDNTSQDIHSVNPRVVAEFGGNLPGHSHAPQTIKTHHSHTEHLKSEDEYEESDEQTVDPSIVDREWFFLTPAGLNSAKRILCVLSDQNPDIEYCPSLPEMVHILLMIMNERQSYATIHQMIKHSRKGNHYFRLNKIQNALFVETFKDIIAKKIPNIAKHFEKIEFDLAKLATIWFKRLFVSFLPFHMSMHMFDGFINEGGKVLYRTGYAILKTFEKRILECQSPTYMPLLITDLSLKLTDDREFFRKAYSLTLRKKHMKTFDEKNRENLDPFKLIGKANTLVKPKLKSQSDIITDMSQWELLYSWLPYRQRVRALDLLFTTSRDGYSLSSLYNACKDCGPCILVILAVPADANDPDNDTLALTPTEIMATQEILPETHESQIEDEDEDSAKIIALIKQQAREGKSLRKELMKEQQEQQTGAAKAEKKKPEARMQIKEVKKRNTCVFGAYLGESFEPTYRYSGTTDSFLYSMYPVETRYKWSRKNDYFVMGRKDKLVIGGGGDGPGLQFDSMLSDGSSQSCITFENEPLAGSSTRFQILKLEVFWFT